MPSRVLLNERQIATRTGKGRWERSTVWGMLRNPAYRGTACYGKTELRPRQRVTRPLRQRKALPSRDVGGHERPRAEWIEVPVPALVSEEMFALAQEQLEKNKHHSPRRTIEPTLLQGMLVCEQCGYALYRTSTHTSKQKLNYYRCIGSDGYRRLNGPVCTNRPVRQDYLDQFVWSEIIRLLDDPGLIQTEIDRRRETAQNADPLRKREEELRREQARVEKSSERLVTAYQEGLVTLAQLRQRMPALQKQTQAVESELQSLKMAAVDEAKYLQLAESLAGFRSKLRVRAEALDIVGATADSAAAGEGSSGWDRHDYAAPFDSDSAIRPPLERLTNTVFRRHRMQCRTQVIFCVRGVISPLLANIYLHYVLDLWVQAWRKKVAQGDMIAVRYADDAVLGFQYREEAERFLADLRERLQKFGLELHPDKTRLIEFGRYAAERRWKRGEGKPETFNFLGFPHICGKNHETGNFMVYRKTIGKRMAAKLKELRQKLRKGLHAPTGNTVKWLQSVVRGYFQYHAVPRNERRMKAFRHEVLRMWWWQLRRRSQPTRWGWNKFMEKLGKERDDPLPVPAPDLAHHRVGRVPLARERFPLYFRFTHCAGSVDQPQIATHLFALFPVHVGQRGPHQVHNAQLHFRAWIHRFNGFWKAFQPIHAGDEEILGSPVLDVRQHL